MAEEECDMRQWHHDYSAQELRSNTTTTTKIGPLISHQSVGWPWHPTSNMTRLRTLALQADVIVYNVGAHYEFSAFKVFPNHLLDHEHALLLTAGRGGLVIVRSPSATHFPSNDGLLRSNLSWTQCVHHNTTPQVITKQIKMLQEMTDRIHNAQYLDIYNMSDVPSQHVGGRDCKHFCQNCTMLRAWNQLVMSFIIKWYTTEKNT